MIIKHLLLLLLLLLLHLLLLCLLHSHHIRHTSHLRTHSWIHAHLHLWLLVLWHKLISSKLTSCSHHWIVPCLKLIISSYHSSRHSTLHTSTIHLSTSKPCIHLASSHVVKASHSSLEGISIHLAKARWLLLLLLLISSNICSHGTQPICLAWWNRACLNLCLNRRLCSYVCVEVFEHI